MSIFDVEDGNKTRSSFSYSQTSRSGTPAASSVSAPSKPPSNSNKITERHFTPRTRRLAVASKSHIRNRIVYHESGPFNPMTSRMARLDFAWAAVKEAANNSDDHYLKDAFRRASKNDGIKKNLLTFVSHLLNNER